MVKTIECACGYRISEPSEPELIAHIQRHGREAHGVELSEEEARELARPEAAGSAGESERGSR